MSELPTVAVPPRAAPPRGPRDRVTPEDLNVAPELLGQPLARPGRRAAALAIDGLCIAALNALGNAWVALALAALLLWQRAQRRAAAAAGAPAAQPRHERPWHVVGAAVLLLGLGALTHQDEARHTAAEEREAAVAAADDTVREPAAEALAASAASAVATGPVRAGAALDEDDEAGSAWQGRKLRALQARIAAQQEELQRLRAPGLGAWQARARHWLDELGEGWLWSLLYFTLLPAGWLGGCPGQTLGKRLLGLRVAELTGKPMTPMRNLKRYGGYAAGMATGGLGLLQLLWDANRQAIQDKTAHTVVLDLRRQEAAPVTA